MLNTLRKIDKSKRAAVLSEVAGLLTPSPFGDDRLGDEHQSVLNEIGQKFGFHGSEVPERFRPAVYRLVQGELKNLLVDTSSLVHVRERLGQKGLLAAELYDVSFSQAFTDCSAKMGVSKELAARTVALADATEHLFPEESGLVGLHAQTLFVRDHPNISNCSILLIAFRKDAKLEVDAGWLVFHDIVEGADVGKPSLMLQQFVEHYGQQIKIGDTYSKFVIQTSIKVDPWLQNSLISADMSRPNDTRFSFRAAHGEVQIGLAYCVQLEPYVGDLRRKGVHVTRNIPHTA